MRGIQASPQLTKRVISEYKKGLNEIVEAFAFIVSQDYSEKREIRY